MKNWKMILPLTLIVMLAVIPMASGTGSTCPGHGTGNAASFLPFYVTAMGNINTMMEQLQDKMGQMDDVSMYSEQLDEINGLIAKASMGTNYLYKKDILLMANTKLQSLLAEMP